MEDIGPLADKLRPQEHASILYSVNAYIDTRSNPDGTVGSLRPEQTTTFYKFRDFLGSIHPNGDTEIAGALADLACSYGKTALLSCIADAMGAGRPRVDGKRRQVAYATSRTILLNQIAADGGGLNAFAPRLKPSIYNVDSKDATGDVVITSYHSLLPAYTRHDFEPGQMSGILLDEVHNVGRERAATIKKESKGAVVFGVSATTDDAKRFIPRVIDRVTMAQGIMTYGFLCSMQFYGIQTGETFTAAHGGRDYQITDTRLLARSNARNKIIVDTARFCIENLGPGLISCIPGNKQEHAFTIAKLLAASGDITDTDGVTRPICVEGVGTARKDSRSVSENFRAGTGDVLTQIRYLEEGYDTPRFRWAILARPVRTLGIITQLLGRGGRLDGDNKVFTAFELIDDELHEPERQKHIWDVFGLPMQQGIMISKKGISTPDTTQGARPSDTRFVGPELPAFLRQAPLPDQENRAKFYFEAFRGQSSPEAVSLSKGLFDMCDATELSHSWAQRILFSRGMRARLEINSQGEVEPHFSQRAQDILQNEVASADDVTLTMASQQLGIGKAPIIKWIKEDGLTLARLHSYQPGTTQKLPHFTAEQFAVFKNKHGVRQTVSDERISNKELRERISSSRVSLRDFFTLRGFSVLCQPVKGESGHPQPTFLRAEIEPWEHAFMQAQPAPYEGFSQLQGYTIRNYEHRPPTIEELFTVASLIQMPVYYFTTRASRRVEYISTEHHEAFLAALEAYIADPDLYAPSGPPYYRVYTPGEAQPPCQELKPAEEEATNEEPVTEELELPETAAPPDPSKDLAYAEEFEEETGVHPVPRTAAAPPKTTPRRRQEKGKPVAFEYAIPVAKKVDTGRIVSTCNQLHHLNSNSLVELTPLAPSRRINAVNLSRYASAQTHSMPTLLAIISCNGPVDVGSTPPVGTLSNGDIGVSSIVFDALSEVLREYGTNPSPIPYTWSFCDDIARYLHMEPATLKKNIMDGNFSDEHRQGMYIGRYRSTLLFCSPALTTRILNYHLRTVIG